MNVLQRIQLEAPHWRVSGRRPYVARSGSLFEIRDGSLVSIPLPYPDCLPLAVDDEGRLIAARESGDRQVRRYRNDKLDATYPFTFDSIHSLAVAGTRIVVARRDGRVQGLGPDTVPRVDYVHRLGTKIHFADALGDRVALCGAETLLCDFEGGVRERLPWSQRVRLAFRGVWRLESAWLSGERRVEPSELGLDKIDDIVGEDWALGSALVRFG